MYIRGFVENRFAFTRYITTKCYEKMEGTHQEFRG
jgi:hypothetical protein